MFYNHYIPGLRKIRQQWRFIAILTLLLITGCTPRVVKQEVIVDTSPSRQAASPPADMNQRLVFSADGDLYTMYITGLGLQRIVQTPAQVDNPALSPDGINILFDSLSGDNRQIKVAPLSNIGDEAWHYRLSSNVTAQNSAPCLSPDGRFTAYGSFRDQSWGIYITEFIMYEGMQGPIIYNELRLTYNKFFDGHPTWSPDGTTIAYTSDRGIRWQIYKMDTMGGDQSPFPGTGSLGSTAYPAWSPDGTKLAFAATAQGDWDIYTMNIDGTGATALTLSTGEDWAPAWSPDGRWIAFVSNRDGDQDLYLIKADGSALYRLTQGPAAESRPAWLP